MKIIDLISKQALLVTTWLLSILYCCLTGGFHDNWSPHWWSYWWWRLKPIKKSDRLVGGEQCEIRELPTSPLGFTSLLLALILPLILGPLPVILLHIVLPCASCLPNPTRLKYALPLNFSTTSHFSGGATCSASPSSPSSSPSPTRPTWSSLRSSSTGLEAFCLMFWSSSSYNQRLIYILGRLLPNILTIHEARMNPLKSFSSSWWR